MGARITSAVRRRRDQHLPGARGAHAVHREHVADAIHDRESRRMPSRPRLVDPLGKHLLDVALRQHLSRARARAVTACRGLVSPSRRLHAVTPTASERKKHDTNGKRGPQARGAHPRQPLHNELHRSRRSWVPGAHSCYDPPLGSLIIVAGGTCGNSYTAAERDFQPAGPHGKSSSDLDQGASAS